MRDIEKKILKSLYDDIKILKRANTKTNEIIDHIKPGRSPGTWHLAPGIWYQISHTKQFNILSKNVEQILQIFIKKLLQKLTKYYIIKS